MYLFFLYPAMSHSDRKTDKDKNKKQWHSQQTNVKSIYLIFLFPIYILPYLKGIVGLHCISIWI